jgi:hypothetical protein
MQDLPLRRHRTQQRRKPIILCDLQFLPIAPVSDGHQIRFHGSSGQEKAYVGLVGLDFVTIWVVQIGKLRVEQKNTATIDSCLK